MRNDLCCDHKVNTPDSQGYGFRAACFLNGADDNHQAKAAR